MDLVLPTERLFCPEHGPRVYFAMRLRRAHRRIEHPAPCTQAQMGRWFSHTEPWPQWDVPQMSECRLRAVNRRSD
jgi:hypothetical protein